MVLAPEHPLVSALTVPEQRARVEAYVDEARRTLAQADAIAALQADA